jgi:GDPmannose 4,6-dehydratase
MWLMLQTEEAEDFVLATGEYHTVREFIEIAFSYKGFDIIWKGEGAEEIGYDRNTGRELIYISEEYYRPTEVDELLGDPTKAQNKLGWKSKTSFTTLVKEMVDHDTK